MINQKQIQGVEYLKYFGSRLKNDGKCFGEIISSIAVPKTVFNKYMVLFVGTVDLETRKKIAKCYIWSVAVCGVETGRVRAVDRKQLECFEMCCWSRL